MLKKLCIAFVVSVFLVSNAAADIIWEEQTQTIVTAGVTYTYDLQFSDSGWQRAHILSVDLSNANLDLTALYDSRGISYLKSIPAMAAERGVVAAVNGDFFNWNKSEAGKGSPLGLTVENGEVISSPSHDTGLAALMENENGTVFTGYVSMHLFVTSPQGYTADIIHINKYHSMQSMVLYTSAWGAATPGSYNGISELVAENGIVKEIRREQPGVQVPENGFVLATSTATSTYLIDNFQVGDPVPISYTLMPDFGKIKTAVGGASVLVRDGEIPEFTNVISGSHPRTAAGVSKDGKTLYLVTVDGRQTATAGMTQTELAAYMRDIGAYEAINFDGGGSTTMVVRGSETGELEVANTVSDGAPRAVSTGLGVRFIGETGALSSIEVNKVGNTVTQGEGVHLYLGAYDENHNPVYIADRTITYSSEDGTFIGNIFYPAHTGTATVTVTCGDVQGTLTMHVSVLQPLAETVPTATDTVRFLLLPGKPAPTNCLNLLLAGRLEEMAAAENIVYTFTPYEEPTILANAYHADYKNNNLFMTLDCTDGGVRATDANQWRALLYAAKEQAPKNLFLFLSNPMQTFSDSAEAELLRSVLSTEFYDSDINVFVCCYGDKTGVETINGVRYITVPKTISYTLGTFAADCKAQCGVLFAVHGEEIYCNTLPLY